MNNILPAITLYQPWATWIMRKWKTIETRKHSRFFCLNHKTILIHAGQSTDAESVNNPYLTKEQILYNPDEVVNGYILGSAYVWDFKSLNDSHSQPSLIECKDTLRFGLFLKNVKVFDHPIPVKGEMGIWYFDMDTKQKVKKSHIDTLKLF